MEREIKLRGSYKSKSGKTYWVYFTIKDVLGNCNGEPSIYFTYDKNGIQERWISLNALENISQYTGLKDKNEKEIFHGDILKEVSMGYVTQVEYIGNQFVSKSNTGYVGLFETNNYLIIGNIFENKNLLSVL